MPADSSPDTQPRHMAIVQSLHLYPIKSCAGVALPEATVGRAGLEWQGVGDREWMVVDAGSGQFLTQRQLPRMALITPQLGDVALSVTAPGQAPLTLPLTGFDLRQPDVAVKVWNHECNAFDAGDAAAAWFSGFLGRAVRLVRFDPAHRRASNHEWTGAIEALNRFSDGYPILLISQASLDDLNERLAEAGREALPMNRFRPNLVLGRVDPYDEDHIVTLKAGAIELKPVKPCPRCPIPSIEQSTGQFGPDPLDILAQYRSEQRTGGVVFGQNLVTLQGYGQTLKAGQEVDLEWNF
jgi:uncharacterized protein YcbX